MASNVKTHDVTNSTGAALRTKLSQIDKAACSSGTTHELKIGKNNKITLKPNPTKNQPGNALISFNGETPSWSDLQPSMNNPKKFKQRHKEFEKKKLGNTYKDLKSQQALVLAQFEVARRVEKSKFPSKAMVSKGVEAAIRKEKPKEMIKMFQGKPQKRREACRMLTSSSSKPAKSQQMKSVSLRQTVKATTYGSSSKSAKSQQKKSVSSRQTVKATTYGTKKATTVRATKHTTTYKATSSRPTRPAQRASGSSMRTSGGRRRK